MCVNVAIQPPILIVGSDIGNIEGITHGRGRRTCSGLLLLVVVFMGKLVDNAASACDLGRCTLLILVVVVTTEVVVMICLFLFGALLLTTLGVTVEMLGVALCSVDLCVFSCLPYMQTMMIVMAKVSFIGGSSVEG